MKQLSTKLYITILLIFIWTSAKSQQSETIPTKGKEFWLGFMQNHIVRSGDLIKVFISSDKNVFGTLSIPLQGYSQNFTVVPNITTELTIPNNIIEHLGSDIIESKGAHILTNDTVSVFALNFDNYTADATKILPIQSIGTEYRITSYPGLGPGTGESEFVIVATEDNTQLLITPTVALAGGKPANTTYTLNLSRGQSYQAKAIGTGDLTGTTIIATSSSGSCRPFAVFSGSGCVNIPIGCTACDYIDDQELPVRNWGKSYYLVPFLSTTSYAYKILADKNGTTVSVNGGAPINLNAGQSYSQFNVTQAVCINSNNPISVVQFMQGASCSGSGDPAMFFVNAADQSIDRVTFATVNSTVLNQHNINVVMKDAFINQLTLDGTPVNTSLFKPFPSCPGFSFFQLSIAQGSHTLASDSGFTAYVYGTGGYESYAFSVGSFSKRPPIVTDTIFCTSQNVTLAAPITLFNAYWTTLSNPSVIIGYGQSITVTPTTTQIYVVKGNALASGCEQEYRFSIEVPTPPIINVTASATDICQYGKVYLNASVSPASSFYQYSWTPTIDLDNPSSPNPVATLSASRWYYCRVSTPTGCGFAVDSVYLNVTTIGNISNTRIISADNSICLGESIQLNSSVEKILARDELNNSVNPAFWSSIQLGTASLSCGSVSGNALYFNGTGIRSAATIGMNVAAGGTVRFSLKISNGIAPCDDAEIGENVVLEYSINGGTTWVLLSTYIESVYPNFTNIAVPIPIGARTTNTLFRWRQIANSGVGQDNWALDNILICVPDNNAISYNWSPSLGLSSTTIPNPIATPTVNSTYTLITTDINTSCSYKDSINIEVGQPFNLNMINDTTICTLSGLPLMVTPSSGTGHTYSWTPIATLSNPTIANPIATPTTSTKYYVTVTSPQGCTKRDSVMVTLSNPINSFVAAANPPSFCVGSSTQLNLGEGIITDDFDPSPNSSWASITGGIAFSSCGSISGNALYFTAAGTRAATTIQKNMIGGGSINFYLKIASGTAPCEDAEPGEDVVLEYSNDNISWFNISTFNEANYPFFTYISITIPPAAQTATARFRWRQINHSGVSQDNWAIDNVEIIKNMTGPLLYSWTPTSSLNNSSIQNPIATPVTSTTYTVNVTNTATGCNFIASVPVTVVPDFSVSITNDTILCSTISGIQLSASASPGTGYSYYWSPSIGLSNTTIYNPIATPTVTTKYKVNVSYNGSCVKTDSVTITVNNPINALGVTANKPLVCEGSSAQLNVQELIYSDNFDPILSSLWSINSGITSTLCGSVSGNALYFTNSGLRYTSTNPINLIGGGSINFYLKISNELAPCDDAEPGESVVLEYSNDGSTWINITTFDEALYPYFTFISIPIPVGAQTTSARFRWRQLSNSGFNQDNWALDNVMILKNMAGAFTYNWTPTTTLSNPVIQNPIATPITSTSYTVTAINTITGCLYTGNVFVSVVPDFTVSTSNDTVLCSITDGAQLLASASPGTGYYYSWTPVTDLSNPFIYNPIARPSITTKYKVNVSLNGSCIKTDSITVTVNNPIKKLGITANPPIVCEGGSTQLDAKELLLFENFDPIILSQWSTITSTSSNSCGSISGNAAYFNTSFGQRILASNSLNLSSGGNIQFYLKIGSGTSPCDDADPNEDVVLEYSINGGATWFTIATYNEASYPIFRFISQDIPLAAQSPATRFRWRQLFYSGLNQDNWALDDIKIFANLTGSFTYTWSPSLTLSSSSIQNPIATPLVNTRYYLDMVNTVTNCTYRDSIDITIAPDFSLSATNDTLLCSSLNGIQLNANASPGNGYLYFWSPITNLSNPIINNPIANPLITTNYSVQVISPNGCAKTDNVLISVNNPINQFKAFSSTPVVCGPQPIQLVATELVMGENFDPFIASQWNTTTGISNNNCGSVSGNAMYFNNAGIRYIQTNSFSLINGGYISFQLKIGAETFPCDDAEVGEDIVLEYSINSGLTWIVMNTYNENAYPQFTYIGITIPPAAMTVNTRFRWRQTSNSGSGQDNWALDNIQIVRNITGTYIYTWTPSADLNNSSIYNPIATPTSNTKYYVTAYNTASTCTYKDSIQITVAPDFNIATSGNTTICNNAPIQLNVSTNPSGTYSIFWSPSSGLSSSTIFNPIASPASTTNYTIQVRSTEGCIKNTNLNVTVNGIAPNATLTASKTLVCKNETIQMNLNVTNTLPCGINNIGCTNTASDKTIGTGISTLSYPFRGYYHDARTQIIYTQAELSAAGIAPGQSIRSIAFQVITKGSSIPYQNFSIKMACTSLNSFSTINFQSVPNVVFLPKTISTVVGWNTFTFENPFIWSGTSNIIIEICYDNVSYTNDDYVYATSTINNNVLYSYTDGGSGCSLNASYQTTFRPNIRLSTCSVNSGGTFTYSWSPTTGLSNPNIANPTATVGTNTNYSVIISDGACPITRDISITVDNSVSINSISPDTSICKGEFANLQVNNGINTALSTVWTPGNIPGASISVNPTTTTYYKVTLTGTICTVKDSVEVIVLAKPIITINPEENICLGETLQLNATGGTQYLWTPATTLNFDNINNPIASPTASTQYNVTVENSVGCTDDSFVIVNVHIPPVYAVTADSSICDGTSITLRANNGNPTFTAAVWTPGNLSGNTVTVSPTVSTKYYVTLGEEFCSYEDSVQVTILNNPTITITPNQEICVNATLQLNATGGTSYAWSPSTGLDNPSISSPVASPTSTTEYTVLVENADGCTAQENVTISVIQHNLVQATADKLTVCENNFVTLQATGGNTYNWVPATTITNPNAANTTAQVVNTTTFTVYSSNSCYTDSAKVTVTTVPQPSIIANDTTICDGNSAQLFSTYYPTGMTYTWSPTSTLSNATIHNPVATPAASTDYTVSLSNGFCSDVDTATVTVLPPLVSDVQVSSVDGQSPLTVSFTNNSVGFTSYLWVFEPGDSSRLKEPTHTFVNPGEYHVQLFQYNSLGCFKTDLFYFVSYDFMIPNLITPNNDGLNDNFVISSIHDRWEVMITNRWGDIVYKSDNYDGTFPGEQDLSDGIYYFYIKDRKSEKEYKGWVQSVK